MGWSFMIRSSDGVEMATATANALGLYLFSNVPQGEYIVELAASNFKAGGALLLQFEHRRYWQCV